MKCRVIACHSNVIQSFKGSVELRTGGVVGVLLLVAAGGGANVCVQYICGDAVPFVVRLKWQRCACAYSMLETCDVH